MINKLKVILIFIKFDISKIFIIGINKTISTSKIRKIIAIKKNWIEKGKRALFFGSNPHSKGEFFSLSWNVFFDVKLIIISIIIKIILITKRVNKDLKIIYTKI